MKDVYIGKIVNTHGIKGEIRILSNFDKKDKVFIPNMTIYIGKKKEQFIINTYRKHKNYDMITLKGINDINDVLKYKGLNVYVKREDLNLKPNEYLLDDILGMKIICDNKEYGIVENIYDNNGHPLLAIKFEKNYYIPYNSSDIKEINLLKKEIVMTKVKDLIL
jgi:16S rRNA processing protein RimM